MLLILVALLGGRAIYVEFRCGALARELRSLGYVKDRSYDGAFAERWIHSTDPDRAPVVLYWYPRRDDSAFEKLNRALFRSSVRRLNSVSGDIQMTVRFLLLGLTRPFLLPVDSRTGFDPNAVPAEKSESPLPLPDAPPTSSTIGQ